MEYKRYIFLDVDGVLNHHKYYDWMHEQLVSGGLSEDEYNNRDILVNNCDPEKLKLLNQLEGCEVVMITSWDHDRCMRVLPELGLKLPIIGGIKARELQEQWLVRGNGIAEWFVEHYGSMPRDAFLNSFEEDGWWHPGRTWTIKNGIEKVANPGELAVTYVIFDDSADMLLDQVRHFVHVNANEGITEKDIKKAKKILNLC